MKQEDMETERWNTSSLPLQNTLWKRLWTWRITDCMVVVVVVVVVVMMMIYGVSG